ncbi:MAG: DUF92 domain-containing protein [Candidatus Marsarchaeota archaeon]|nr:DUF92 domain-containing protein [Candidatus Marsarchaeota archaeon]
MEFFTLDMKATASAVAMGVLIIYLGGGFGLYFFIAMLMFLVLSGVVSYVGKAYKQKKRLFEKVRTTRNVIANGLCPTAIALLFYISTNWFSGAYGILIFAAFVGSVAAITSDKFSSELGVLDGMPTQLISFKKVKKGVSGGVTAIGLMSGLLGSALISITPLLVYGQLSRAFGPGIWYIVLAALAGGFFGTLFDSILGYYEEKGVGNKYTSNFFASVAGSVVALLIAVWLIPL